MKHANIIKSTFAAVALLPAAVSWADTWKDLDTGYTWTYTASGGAASVYKGSWVAAVSPEPTAALTIPSRLGGKTVTCIGPSAFYYCSGLTSVTMPNGVSSIGASAFSGCSGLVSVKIPGSVTSIGEWAFSGCSGLTGVTIPNGVRSIGAAAFSGCIGLASMTIPNGVTSIGSAAFYGCSGLASVAMPNSVKSIGTSAFSSCSGLTSVTVPDGVTSIEGSVFMDCIGLVSATIPNSVTRIGNSAFSGCSGLTSVSIPRSVKSIGDFAFYGCGSLTSVYVSIGDADRVKRLMENSGFDTTGVSFVCLPYKVTFGKNSGTGGDNYVTATYGSAMPTPRTAPTRTGWAFGGYWDTLAQDENGNPKGKQYYDANMKSVRAWDKKGESTLWAKWTVRVTLGKNGGTGGDSYVTVTYNQPFPKRTMPTKSGYTFGGYWISSSSKTGQCYEADGTGTSTMKWTTGGTPAIWALWTANP